MASHDKVQRKLRRAQRQASRRTGPDRRTGQMPSDRWRKARAVADTGMGEVCRQLDYKATWKGRALVVADRWFPSSKTCNDCGAVKAKLRLSQRTFACEAGGACG
ncbi:zinc ribbon domain-containing protein [Salinactinospora qingdaonensis]|uniref:zinc ribbon domain-containing protein n=1 Tax=Salinactinospora qingdaonensis TaxID=702744 RepID=UPI0031EF0EFF